MKKFISILISIVLVFTLVCPAFAAQENGLPFENSAFYNQGDYSIHYRTYSVDNAKNQIMLIHGFGLSSASFEDMAAEYNKEGYSVVTVDMPNFGYSSRETKNTNFVDREELVYGLMNELGGKWILGGHSMGGGIAANVAVDHPESVEGLVLFAPQVSMQANESMAKMMRSDIITGIFDAFIKYGVKIPFIMNILVAASFSDVKYSTTYDCSKISNPLKIKGTGAGWAIMASHTRGIDSAAFGKLEMPICVITCSNDLVAQASNLDPITKSGAVNMEVIEVNKGGHMMFEYDAANTVALTMNTLESI